MSRFLRMASNNESGAKILSARDLSEILGQAHAARYRASERGPADEDFLAAFLQVLYKRKWTVITFFVLVVSFVAGVSLLLKPQYEAVARIVFNRENTDPLGFKDVGRALPEDSDYSVSLDTQVRILESDTLALQTIRELHLDTNANFSDQAGAHRGTLADAGSSESTAVAKRREALLKTFHDALSVSKDKNTRVIEIRYRNKDAMLAAQIANAVSRAYIEHNFKMRFESTKQTSDWLAQQLAELQNKVEVSQQKLVEYQKAHGILGLDEKQNVITARLDDLNREMTAAQTARIQSEASYRLTLSENPELVVKAEPDALIEKLRNQEAALNLQYAQASTQLGPSNPKMLELSNQIKEVQAEQKAEVQKISARVKNRYTEASVREKMIRAALEKQKQEANQLNESAIEYSLLKRDVDSNRELYQGLLQKLKEAGVSAGLRSSNIQIVDVAQVPATPSEPKILRNLVAAVFLGLLGGVAVAFIQERFDHTVRSVHQVQFLSQLPYLGMIPLGDPKALAASSKPALQGSFTAALRQADPMKIVAISNPTSVQAESYRAVLNSILLGPGTAPQTILVTSAVTQEGKTTTSVNLAIVLARQGKRVLLVDGDLRKPSVERALGLEVRSGLSTLMKNSLKGNGNGNGNKTTATGAAIAAPSAFPDPIISFPRIPNLFVLPAGPCEPTQFELISSDLVRDLIADWRERFDHIIIDTPPVLLASDAVRLSVQVDSVILVVRYGYTPQDAVRRAQESLRLVNASVTGVILNGYDPEAAEFSYYGKYAYTYVDDGPAQS
jgi:polysaccharide biosynthesis transport protein